jgi:hypothetical protein
MLLRTLPDDTVRWKRERERERGLLYVLQSSTPLGGYLKMGSLAIFCVFHWMSINKCYSFSPFPSKVF